MLRAVLGRGDGGDSDLRDRIRDIRFERTALYAHEHGFDVISSSLGISRLKNMNQVNASGQRMVEIAKRERFICKRRAASGPLDAIDTPARAGAHSWSTHPLSAVQVPRWPKSPRMYSHFVPVGCMVQSSLRHWQ